MRKIKKIGLVSILGMAMLMLVSCGKEEKVEQVQKEATKGYIWEATNGDNSIYLVGTMHPAPKAVNFFNDNINEIIEKTDTVALEIDLKDHKTLEDVMNYQNENYLMKGGELKDLLTEEEGEKLDKVLKDYNLTYKDVKHLNIAGLITTLNNMTFQNGGFEGEVFDNQLSDKYKEKGKNVVALETVEFQLDIISSEYNIENFREFLNEYDKSNIDESIKMAQELFDGYVTGDKDIAEKGVEDNKANEEMYKKLIVDRNINMAEKIDIMAKEEDRYMVAVGYLHYFGEDSILKLLEEKGYTIEEIL